MGTVRHSGHTDRSVCMVPTTRHRATSMSKPELARASVLAALDGLVEAGLATWHDQGADRLELRCSGGQVWLLDSSGVTRLR
jgi:hypothetical protein